MKKHPEHKIDELLHRSLHNLQGETSAQDWEEIRQRLQGEQRHEPWFWFFRSRKYMAVIALLFVSIIGTGYYAFYKSGSETIALASAKNEITTKTANGNETQDNQIAAIEEHENSHVEGNLKHDVAAEKQVKESENEVIVNRNQHLYSKRSDDINKASKTGTDKSQIAASSKNIKTGSKEKSAVNTYKEPVKNTDTEFAGNTIAEQIENNANTEITANVLKDSADENLAEASPEVKRTDETIKTVAKETVKKSINTAGKKFSFGIRYSPMFSGRSISMNAGKTEQTHKNYFDLRNSQEKPSTGYNAGIFAQYNIWKNLAVQSGIEYQQQREKASYKFYNNEIPVIDSASGNILGYIEFEDTTGTNYTHQNTYSYASIPLLIGYEIPLSNKWSFGLQAGGNARHYPRKCVNLV
ncbi:MAG: outer membrane beta-barrel protein [Bacteroidia bacterium]